MAGLDLSPAAIGGIAPQAPPAPPKPPTRGLDLSAAATADEGVRQLGQVAGEFGGVLGKAAQGAVSPITDTASAIVRHLPKALQKQVKDAERVGGSTLQKASQLFGVWQDYLGATARDAQEGGLAGLARGKNLDAMETGLHSALFSGDMLHKLTAFNDKNALFSPDTLDALAKGNPGAIASVGATLRKYPHLAGAASLLAEIANPVAGIAGKAAEGGAKLAGIGGRALEASAARTAAQEPERVARAAANQEADAARAEAKAAGHPVPPKPTIGNRVQRVRDKVAELKGNVDQDAAALKTKAGHAFNHYHDVEKKDAPRGVLEWAQKREVDEKAAEQTAKDKAQQIFGDLTKNQQVALIHRYESSGAIQPPKTTNTFNDVKLPAPPVVKGPSMDERVQIWRDYQSDLDARLKAEDPKLLPNESEAPFMSRSGTKNEPWYQHDREDGILGSRAEGGSGGPLGVAKGARGTKERVYSTLQEAFDAGETLDPKASPVRQFERTAGEREKALAGQKSLRELETLPVGTDASGNPIMARENYRYQIPDAQGNIQIFADEKAFASWARGQNRPRIKAEVLAEHGNPTLPNRITSASYLKGRLDAKALAGRDVGKLGKATTTAIARGVNAAKPQGFVDALAPQTARVDALGNAIGKIGTDRSEYKMIGAGLRGKITDLRGDYRAAQNVAKGPVLKSGEGTDVDKLAAKIAAHRIDRPAGTNLSTFERDGQTHVLGNPSSWNGSQYAKDEVMSVRVALDRARKGKLIPEGGVKPTKATPEDAVRFLDQHANAIAEARARTEASLDTNKLRYKNGEGRRVAMTDGQKASVLKDHVEQHVDVHGQISDALAKTHPVAKSVQKAATSVGRGQEALVGKAKTAAIAQTAALHGIAPKVVARFADAQQEVANDLAHEFAQVAKAKLDRKLADTIARETDSKLEKFVTKLTEKAAKAPVEGGVYGHESGLTLGSVDAAEKLLHKSVYNFLEQARKMGAPDDEATHLGRFFTVSGHLARAGIVVWPTVHVIWNLGRAFLAEGGDVRDLLPGKAAAVNEEVPAHILAKATFPLKPRADGKALTYGDMAHQVGASPQMSQRAFGIGPEADSTIAATPGRSLKEFLPGQSAPGKLSRRGSIDRFLSRGSEARIPKNVPVIGGGHVPGWNDSQHLVFNVFEHRYASALLKKKLASESKQVGAASREIRKALGDFNNTTSFERQFNKMFFFYSWMKTAVPFWAKKGFFDPRQWNAPITAIRQNNQNMGDPLADYQTNPWSIDLWENLQGGFTRLSVPDPARVLNPLAQLAGAPIDAVTGTTVRGQYGKPQDVQGFGVIPGDAAGAIDYLRGHLTPALAPIADAVAPGNRFQRLEQDPNDPWQQQLKDAGNRVAQNYIAPIQGVQSMIADPLGSLTGTALGGFVSDSKALGEPQALHEKRITGHYTRLIDKARARRDFDAVARLTLQMHKALEAAGAAHVAPVSSDRSPIIPPSAPAPGGRLDLSPAAIGTAP